jgi:hypothetical protein
MASRLLGRTQPRLWTPPLRPLNRRTSHGYAIADFADTVGEPLLPWQRWLVIHAMELQPDGFYRFRVIIVLVARQNGKSSVKRTVSLWRLHIDGARLVLGVAQDVSLAREQWSMALETIEASPDLREDLAQVRRVNGDEWFRLDIDHGRELDYDDDEYDESLTLAGGGRYKIAASNRKAGRGLSIDELNIDELREQRNWNAWAALSKTTMARPDSQIWCMSNAGDDGSVVLNQLRDAALSGRDPSIGLFEWSGEDDCALDDWDQIRQANPGLGHTVSEAAIRTALTTDPPAIYRTEVLCQRVEQLDGAVNFAAWKDCTDAAGNMDPYRKRLAVGFDVAPDGEHATLAVAARMPDGRGRLEIAAAWDSATAARAELAAKIARIRPCAVAWYPTGPAAELAGILRPAPGVQAVPLERARPGRPAYVELTGTRVAEVCMELAGLTRGRRIVQPGDPLLDAHIKGAAKLNAADGWRFTRRGAGHVDAAYAAAAALSTALILPEPKRAGIRMVS